MFEYEHERVCFALIDECDGGMSATIIISRLFVTVTPKQDGIILHMIVCIFLSKGFCCL